MDLSDEPRVGCGMRLNLSTRAGMRPHLALLASIHPPPSVPQDDAPGTQASEAGWPGEAQGRVEASSRTPPFSLARERTCGRLKREWSGGHKCCRPQEAGYYTECVGSVCLLGEVRGQTQTVPRTQTE